MASARRNATLPQIPQGGVFSGDSGKAHDPETKSSGSATSRGPKSRASRKAASKQKGKQPNKRRRNIGKLSKLPGMPLDVLYEVSHRIISDPDDGVCDNVFGIYRCSLFSTRCISCKYRGPTKPFTTFSQASPQDRLGGPPSITFQWPNGHLRVLRTWRNLHMQIFYTTLIVWCVRAFVLHST